MEVTRQLRLDQLSKNGLAQIQLTCWWDNQRIRFSSGQRCLPADWDSKRERVKPRDGTNADTANPILDRYADAAEQVHLAAQRAGRNIAKTEMRPAIERRYQELLTEEQGLPPLPAPPEPAPVAPPSFEDYYAKWLDEQAHTVNRRTGRPLSTSYLTSLANSLRVLQEYAAAAKVPLTFAGLDRTFYVAFQRFFLEKKCQDLNTFGKHVRALKNFLGWAEEHDVPGLTAKFRRFEAPEIYRGADALTQAELLAIAGLDFHTAPARTYVEQHFETAFTPTPGAPRKVGARLSQVDARRVAERLRVLEFVRDKLLVCCYLGLRISDADRLAPRHIQGDLVKIEQGKTTAKAIIPFIDDDVFKPVQLVAKYAHLRLPTCLPVVVHPNEYLPAIAALAGITRLALTTKIGRKTFATLKIYQGIPKPQVMLATGHKTETSFNRYLGIDEQELLRNFRKTARRVAESSGGLAPNVA
jgi:hypothetical protein